MDTGKLESTLNIGKRQPWVMQCPEHISAADGAGIGGAKMGYLPSLPGQYCGVWMHF